MARSIAAPDDKAKKALATEIQAFRAALYAPDATGTVPLQRVAAHLAWVGKNGGCIAQLSIPKLGAVLLTKETIFGKGGKAYLNIPAQATMRLDDERGHLVAMICRQAVLQTTIRLSELTSKSEEKVSPWDPSTIRPKASDEDCSSI